MKKLAVKKKRAGLSNVGRPKLKSRTQSSSHPANRQLKLFSLSEKEEKMNFLLLIQIAQVSKGQPISGLTSH
jgi:hypothetical protein